MAQLQLEQCLNRGAIRAWWGFSMRTFIALAAGAILGLELGMLLYGGGLRVAALMFVGALAGAFVLRERRGILAVHRWRLAARFHLRRLLVRPELDGRPGARRDLPGSAYGPSPAAMRVRIHTPPAAERGDRAP